MDNEQFMTVSQQLSEKAKAATDGDAAAIFESCAAVARTMEKALDTLKSLPPSGNERTDASMAAIMVGISLSTIQSRAVDESARMQSALTRLVKNAPAEKG